MTKKAQSVTFAAIAGGIALLAAPAVAQDMAAPLQVHVRTDDLDLTREVGARIMANRIELAVKAACAGEPDLRLLDRAAFYKRCHQETLHRTLAELNAPLVTALAEPAAKAPVVVAER